jgi:hypothetical protein
MNKRNIILVVKVTPHFSIASTTLFSKIIIEGHEFMEINNSLLSVEAQPTKAVSAHMYGRIFHSFNV